MFKLPYDEFKEEIRAEMYGYEEMTEDLINKWFERLEAFVGAKKPSDRLIYSNNKIEVNFKDETDLFMIVDRYLAAIVNEEMDKYFTDWTF